MIKKEYKYSEITSKIIGCAMRVHSTIGNGFQEVIYQRAMAIEFEDDGLGYQREIEMPIYYKDVEIGTRRVDFLVEEKVLTEFKALSQLDNSHIAQTLNYLEAFKLEIALLINFGAPSLQFKRLTNEYKLNKSGPQIK